MSQVIEVLVPAACHLPGALKAVNFSDAYQAPVSRPELGPQDVYRVALGRVTAWVKVLFKMRGIVASILGLRHERVVDVPFAPGATYKVGQRVGMFTIRSIEPDELIVGGDDKHLYFRMSVFRSSLNGVETASVSTAVEIHNITGGIYMLVIKPFHRVIARAMLQRAVDAGRL
jgi:hypothetical protein